MKGEKRIENNVRRRLLGRRNKTRKHVSLVSAFFLILTKTVKNIGRTIDCLQAV